MDDFSTALFHQALSQTSDKQSPFAAPESSGSNETETPVPLALTEYMR
jgi:hypothetical protein